MAENNNSTWNWGNAVGDFFSGMFSGNEDSTNDKPGKYKGHQSNFSRGVGGMASAGLKYYSSRQEQDAMTKRNQDTIAAKKKIQQMNIDAKKVKGVGSGGVRKRAAQFQVPDPTVGAGLNRIQAEQKLQTGLIAKAGV